MQGHVIYSLRSGAWLSLDGTYYAGGRTTVDGVEQNTLQQSTRVGLTLALPVDRYNSAKAYGSSTASSRMGHHFTLIGVAWQHRWGDGY